MADHLKGVPPLAYLDIKLFNVKDFTDKDGGNVAEIHQL
jgi:hypothetical protein